MDKEKYNVPLLMDVLRARPKKGLKQVPHTIPLEDHPLLGKHLRRKCDGRVYVIEAVLRQWWWGYYTSLLIQANGSHGVIWWENISCAEDSCQADAVRANNSDYELVENERTAT